MELSLQSQQERKKIKSVMPTHVVSLILGLLNVVRFVGLGLPQGYYPRPPVPCISVRRLGIQLFGSAPLGGTPSFTRLSQRFKTVRKASRVSNCEQGLKQVQGCCQTPLGVFFF